jgi:hypothetical protein
MALLYDDGIFLDWIGLTIEGGTIPLWSISCGYVECELAS